MIRGRRLCLGEEEFTFSFSLPHLAVCLYCSFFSRMGIPHSSQTPGGTGAWDEWANTDAPGLPLQKPRAALTFGVGAHVAEHRLRLQSLLARAALENLSVGRIPAMRHLQG
jgi:hypothetical protein